MNKLIKSGIILVILLLVIEVSHSTQTSTQNHSNDWVTGTMTNGGCVYSYSVNGVTYGPYTLDASTCGTGLISQNVNGIHHVTIMINDKVVYSK